MSDSTTDIYTETKSASGLFNLPLDTCDFSNCSIVTSSGDPCPQASISKASSPST